MAGRSLRTGRRSEIISSSSWARPCWGHIRTTSDQITADNTGHQRSGVHPAQAAWWTRTCSPTWPAMAAAAVLAGAHSMAAIGFPYAAQVIQVTRKTRRLRTRWWRTVTVYTIPTIDRRPSAVLSAFSQVVRHHK